MRTLETSHYRLYPLPSVYNFHSSSLYPLRDSTIPVVVQTKVFADPQANLLNYQDVARHVAMIIVEDCLNNMKRVRITHYVVLFFLSGHNEALYFTSCRKKALSIISVVC